MLKSRQGEKTSEQFKLKLCASAGCDRKRNSKLRNLVI